MVGFFEEIGGRTCSTCSQCFPDVSHIRHIVLIISASLAATQAAVEGQFGSFIIYRGTMSALKGSFALCSDLDAKWKICDGKTVISWEMFGNSIYNTYLRPEQKRSRHWVKFETMYKRAEYQVITGGVNLPKKLISFFVKWEQSLPSR